MSEGKNPPLGLHTLLVAAYARKAAGLAGATAIFLAILAYAFWLRYPYVATAHLSVGYVASQRDEWGVVSMIPIEPIDDAERYLRYEALPRLNLQQVCTVQARMFQRMFVSCSADDEAQSRQRIGRVVDSFLERHQARFEMMLRPAREKADGERRRLDLLLRAAKRAKTPQEQTRAAIETADARERLAMSGNFRKMDRVTRLEPPGIAVTRKQLTPSTIAAAVILSLAFGAFVSVSLAAASTLRHGGDVNRPPS